MGLVGAAALVLICLALLGLIFMVVLVRLEPLQQAIAITGVVGGLELLLGLFVFGVLSGPQPSLLVPSLLLMVEGAVFMGLCYGISQRVQQCALAAAALYTVGTLLSLLGDGNVRWGLVVRAIFLFMLWRAFLQLRGELVGEQERQERRLQFEAMRGAGPRAFQTWHAPPAELAPAPAPAPAGRPVSGRLVAPPPPAAAPAEQPAPSGPARVCPNCAKRYHDGRERCETCKVVMYDD